MSTVTGRINEIKQPRGGYLKPSAFDEICFEDGRILGEENIHASVVGLAVDYLTRFLMGEPVQEAFHISCIGYSMKRASSLRGSSALPGEPYRIESLLERITGLDDDSIDAACRTATYDMWYRNPMAAAMAKGPEETNPDGETVRNIRIMAERSVAFWEKYGPVTCAGFTFEPSGYSNTVTAGDGDYLTRDTLWDFKVTKSRITNKQTLQILMYWIMGQHSGQEIFRGITKLGFFNPRLNRVWLLDAADIPPETIRAVEREVICYP